MPLKHFVLGLAIAAMMPAALATAQAENGLYVPLFTYRTGPFAGSGTPYANDRLSHDA
jgi:branched-chain amino acid transport system substrate-binding protein